MEKKCRHCGKDVSQLRRVKDEAGNYFCEPCYATAGAGTPKAAVKHSEPMPANEPAASPAATGGGDELALVDEPRKKEEPKEACGVCKMLKPARVVQFVDGESICNGCLAKRRGTTPGLAAKRELDPASMPSPFVAFMSSGPGIVVTGAASVVTTMLVMMGVIAITKWGGGEGIGALMVSSAALTVYIICLSLLLLASMLMVDKLLGGVGFGTISGVIWKSMLIVTVQTVLTAFSTVSDVVFYGNFLAGPVLSFLGFMLLFRLDFFESMLLSAANWVVGYVAKFAIIAWVFHSVTAGVQPRVPTMRIDPEVWPESRPYAPPNTDQLDDEESRANGTGGDFASARREPARLLRV